MSLLPPRFDYEPVPPFHATSVQHGIGATSSVTDDLRTAVLDAWRGEQIFGAVIDSAGYAVGCYRTGYLVGVSAVFEVISDLTLERQSPAAYDLMLQVEMYCRLNWSRL